MNSLAIIDKTRPEECLARLQSRQPQLLSDLASRLSVRPNLSFTWYTPVERIRQALEENRRNLAALPDQEDLGRLVEAVRNALATISERAVRRHVAQLIGSFPNANPTDPESYIAALVFDLLDCQIPDAVLALTCQEIRRTSRFVPTISEVIGAARQHLAQCQQLLNLEETLPRTRAQLEYGVQCAERTLAHVMTHGHKPPAEKENA